jgi:hypothetical protein
LSGFVEKGMARIHTGKDIRDGSSDAELGAELTEGADDTEGLKEGMPEG